MYTKLTTQIMYELFEPKKQDLLKREDKLFILSLEAKNIPYEGEMIVYYPGGYIKRYGEIINNKYHSCDMPTKYLAELYSIHKARDVLFENKRKVKGFLNRIFLHTEAPGDLPALVPKALHVHFSKELQESIYNSVQILHPKYIKMLLRKEDKALDIIKRQLLENIILQG